MENQEIQFLSNRLWNGFADFEPGLYPYCVEEVVRKKPKAFRTRGQDFLILALLISGKLNYCFQTEQLVLVPGEILLIPPQTVYGFGFGGNTGEYWKLVLEISGTRLEQELRCLNLNHVIHRKHPDSAGLIDTIRSIGDGMADIPARFPWLAGKTVELLYSLREPGAAGESPLFAAARNFIENALSVPVNLSLLEDHLHISRSTLGRLFRSEAGVSPREYWLRRKIHRAQYYLNNTDFSIKEIADLLGYSSQFHFSGEFLKRTGLSPSVFRAKNAPHT